MQQQLPKLKVEKIKRVKKLSQPKSSKSFRVKKFELLHRPFDLAFRAKVGRWLDYLKKKGLKIHEILGRKRYLLVKYYFFPVDGIWLTQKQVSRKLGNMMVYKVRKNLVQSLTIVWERVSV